MTVEPTMVREPSQSMALRPARTGVRGVSRLRRKAIRMKTVPVMGTVCLSAYRAHRTGSEHRDFDARLM